MGGGLYGFLSLDLKYNTDTYNMGLNLHRPTMMPALSTRTSSGMPLSWNALT